jgi:glutathione S-transferase
VIPDNARGLCDIIDQWADNTLFPPILFQVIPDLLDAAGDQKLKDNREKLIGMSTDQMRKQAPPYQEALKSFCGMLEKQLAHQDFFLGKQFTMADASLYHPFFFLSLNPAQFAKVAEFPSLMRWYERVRAIA